NITTLPKPECGVIVHEHRRKMRKQPGSWNQGLFQFSLILKLPEPFEGKRLLDMERSGCRAYQFLDVRAATEGKPDFVSHCPDICPGRAANPEPRACA